MPSTLHEVLVEMFRNQPDLAVQLLRGGLSVDVPEYAHAQTQSAEFTAVTPTEYRADAVVVLHRRHEPVMAIVVEAQLRADPSKRHSWPVYLATLHARLRCPVLLLVVCTKLRAARWCARPIHLGHPGFVLAPLVVGPNHVPVVTELAVATRTPELAALSAMAHAGGPDGRAVLHTFVMALRDVDEDKVNLYADGVLRTLPPAARTLMEELMGTRMYEFQSDFARRYYGEGLLDGRDEGYDEGRLEGLDQGRQEGLDQGRVAGEASALLTVLAARGVDVPDDARTLIANCQDLVKLDSWLNRAVTVEKLSDLFA